MMTKKEAIGHFGSVAKLAKALGISVQAVHKWGEFVPPVRAYHVRAVMEGGGGEQSCNGVLNPPHSTS
jgi:DNA-binding transcriptional regulator YdaS (Cro superfamily)